MQYEFGCRFLLEKLERLIQCVDEVQTYLERSSVKTLSLNALKATDKHNEYLGAVRRAWEDS